MEPEHGPSARCASAGAANLIVDRHDGGELDWFSADAGGPIASATTPAPLRTTPGRLRYPSAPHPRWWQIEDAQVSIGGQAPSRANLATLVLIDLGVNHSNDWFTFSVPVDVGQVVTFEQVDVLDSFGDRWPLVPPPDWSLFTTAGLDGRSLVMWATARSPLAGPVLDEIVVGIDEDANAVWAVEQVVAGRTVATPPKPAAPPPDADLTGRRAFSYLAMTPIPPHWHPYVVEDVEGRRRFVQGRAADLSGRTPTCCHRLPPASLSIPVEATAGRSTSSSRRRYRPTACGWSDGRCSPAPRPAPVLWTQRRRQPLLNAPTLGLRFDVLRPEDAV